MEEKEKGKDPDNKT